VKRTRLDGERFLPEVFAEVFLADLLEEAFRLVDFAATFFFASVERFGIRRLPPEEKRNEADG